MSNFALLTALFLCSLNRAASDVYHIATDLNDDLCIASCLTLSQFATNSSYHLHSNTTLIFLPGTHYLTVNLKLSHMYKFSMNIENPLTTARIECTSASHILLSSIQHVHINNLQFFGCEGNHMDKVEQLLLQDSRFEGRGYGGSALQLTETSAQIFNVTFVLNLGACIIDPRFPVPVCYGSAIFAHYSKVSLTRSRFKQNNAHAGGAIAANNTIIHVDNCMIDDNVALIGGSFYSLNSSLIVEGSEFSSNHALEVGGGVLFSSESIVSIKASKFDKNFATDPYGLGVGGVISCSSSDVLIETSDFDDNFAANSGGVLFCRSSTVLIKGSNFFNNFATMNGGVLYSEDSRFIIETSGFFGNFASGNGGVLYSTSSNITMQVSEFGGNSATRDGGILQSDSSTIAIEVCDFKNNSVAHRGGVIFSATNMNDIKIDDSNYTNNSPIGAGIHSTTDHAITEVYYIIPTVTDSMENCTVSCLILSQFATDFSYHSNRYLNSNVTLFFLPGTHYLTINITISNTAISLVGSINSTAEIVCRNNSNIFFLYSQYVEMANLELIGCGGSKIMNVAKIVLQDITFTGQSESETSLEFIQTTATIFNCTFVSNQRGKIKEAVEFDFNLFYGPVSVGGAIIATRSDIDIVQSTFKGNRAGYGGAIFAETHSVINLNHVTFIGNSGEYGGVLYSSSSSVIINACKLVRNTATYGGALYFFNNNITLEASEFDNNLAIQDGGAMYYQSSNVRMSDNEFTNNNSTIGAVFYAADHSEIMYQNSLLISNNSADSYAVIYLTNSKIYGQNSGRATFSNNLGSLVIFDSNITFAGYVMFANNHPPQNPSVNFQEGGAITLFQSNAFFDGTCNFVDNHALNGGAISSTESKFYVSGNATVAQNMATQNGGGVYLSNSEMNLQQKSTFVLFNNTAIHKGGGVHAISSTITTTSAYTEIIGRSELIYAGSRLYFTQNTAQRGGGLSLEGSTKFYVLKYNLIHIIQTLGFNSTIFTANVADYGGAVYVDDYTNPGTCATLLETECFFQVLAIYGLYYIRLASNRTTETQNIQFTQNYARVSGSTLYGGLLDRCTVSQFAEIRHINRQYLGRRGEGKDYFDDIAISKYYNLDRFGNILDKFLITTNISISSPPVNTCLCIRNELNCTYQNHVTEVKKGQTFVVSLVAVDQIGQPVNATIQTSLSFTESGLAEGQLAREIPGECTDLTFNVISPHNSERLTLYASDGPCKDVALSVGTVAIHFLPCSCPIGFQILGTNSINCTCECHSDIRQHVEECDSLTGSVIKSSQSRAWISYVNDTSNRTGYLVYSNCPFDYCHSVSSLINLNQPNGADAQCAFNRLSLLCGSCQPGLSLSLGSSRCLPCPIYWPVLLIAITIAAILAGMALVALLLVLNMTVAVGTLNGLIFYANVVYASKTILLPFQETNFITVFISWLNLELGIDTCYFPGMNTYIKTWLQLAFPAYVILLVVLVIIISSYSTRFSNLIGKKDPVATLATLILLSYAKLLEVCFKSLSIGILTYPDGSSEILWLPDATVKYLSGKHVPLFIAAVLILLIGLVYTALLFSWQWVLYLPGWRIFRWSRNPKIHTFIETYHTPYTPKHRYWTGLLLIVRIILYLVAAVNVSNDPTIAITAISFTVCFIFAFRQFIGSRMYRKWPVDILETFFYLNVLSFAIFTWYFLDNPVRDQKAAAYTSVIITFIVLLLIILCHVYVYTTFFLKVKKTKLGRMINRLFADKPKPKCPPLDDDIHKFNELLDMIDRPVNTNDYNIPLKLKATKPTQSVVEVHHPQLAPPDPEEVEHISGAVEAVQAKV